MTRMVHVSLTAPDVVGFIRVPAPNRNCGFFDVPVFCVVDWVRHFGYCGA